MQNFAKKNMDDFSENMQNFCKFLQNIARCFGSFRKSLKTLATYQMTQQRPETKLWLNLHRFHASELPKAQPSAYIEVPVLQLWANYNWNLIRNYVNFWQKIEQCWLDWEQIHKSRLKNNEK